jgi:hypothetical protein
MLCNVFSFGCFPGVWVLIADVSEPSIGSIFIGRLILHRLAYEDGTDRGFRNVGYQHSDAGKTPKKILHIKRGEILKSACCFSGHIPPLHPLLSHWICWRILRTLVWILCYWETPYHCTFQFGLIRKHMADARNYEVRDIMAEFNFGFSNCVW